MLILFIGGIASGKTTLRLLLRNHLRSIGRRVLSFSHPPFSYLTYVLLKFILLIAAIPAHPHHMDEHPIATLEKERPALLGRVIGFIALFDLLQAASIALLTSIISSLGFDVIVEDSTQTIVLDHFLYLRIYRESYCSTGSANLYRAILNVYLRYLSNATCIYLKASGYNRFARSLRRGYRTVKLHVLHDQLRSEALERLSRIAGHSIKVDTDGKTRVNVLLEVIRQVENN